PLRRRRRRRHRRRRRRRRRRRSGRRRWSRSASQHWSGSCAGRTRRSPRPRRFSCSQKKVQELWGDGDDVTGGRTER
ncbi:MAG: hypothetical protein FJ137_23245, partial [Deltaproteobacteria bacterium]|nr:hypothetical protein [Deltaproteobacteria bacterium]